jgi:hypothetical protein
MSVRKTTKEAATKKAAKRKVASKRELIDTGTNKLFVRRNARGTSFKKVVDVGRSLAARPAIEGEDSGEEGPGRPRRCQAAGSSREAQVVRCPSLDGAFSTPGMHGLT